MINLRDKQFLLLTVFLMLLQVPTIQAAGSGILIDSGQLLGSLESRGIELADLDGDGDLDAFVANRAGQPDRVFLNDGNGTFTDTGQSLGMTSSEDVGLADLDGDGDVDAFVANDSSPNRVFLNDGTGNFTDTGQNVGPSQRYGEVGLGDLDGDGDVDVFVATGFNDPQPNRVFFNDGTGNFTDSGQLLGSFRTQTVSLGDFDGDGDLDAFTANRKGNPNKVWLNDGSGTFTDSGQALGNSDTLFGVIGDLDGDGDLDAFTVNHNLGGPLQADKVWLNDGTGIFTDSGQAVGLNRSFVVRLGDLDNDGDLDAIVGLNFSGDLANRVFLNNGSGVFSDSGQLLGSSNTGDIALGDVDGDSDLDAFVVNGLFLGGTNNESNRVWLNQTDPLEIFTLTIEGADIRFSADKAKDNRMNFGGQLYLSIPFGQADDVVVEITSDIGPGFNSIDPVTIPVTEFNCDAIACTGRIDDPSQLLMGELLSIEVTIPLSGTGTFDVSARNVKTVADAIVEVTLTLKVGSKTGSDTVTEHVKDLGERLKFP